MQHSKNKENTSPWTRRNPFSKGYQCQDSFIKYLVDKNNSEITVQKQNDEYPVHTEACEIDSSKNLACHEPIRYPALEYRHQHQQHLHKQLRHSIQCHSSRYTFASQQLKKCDSPSSIIISTDKFIQSIFSGWRTQKPNRLFTKLQPKPKKLSSTYRSRYSLWKLIHQNKNSTEKPAGRLLWWSSSNGGGSVEKKQFDREYRILRIIKQQQQLQRTKQVKHTEFLFYNAFVKNTLTARKY